MKEATKKCTGEDLWQLQYADDLVLSAESKEGMEQKFLKRKLSLETRGMKVNLGTTKLMVTAKKSEVIRSGSLVEHVDAELGQAPSSASLLKDKVINGALAPCFELGPKLFLFNLFKTEYSTKT